MNGDASTTCAKTQENVPNAHTKLDWFNPLIWEKATKYVNKIQARIAKAVKNNQRNLVKRLQYLLSNSFYAKLLAVKKVVTNKGKNTCGVDGVIWKTPQQKLTAALNLSRKGYKAQRLRRVFIKKYGKKEKRPLGIPTMIDRAMQALYVLGLEPIAETTADRVSFGFRKHRSTQDAMVSIFRLLARKNSAQWILEGDIKSCFDQIDHDWLLSNIPMDSGILRKFLKAGYMYEGVNYETDSGTPQGGLISATLANMTLDGLEATLHQKLLKRTRTGAVSLSDRVAKKLNLIRYADDFIIRAVDQETATQAKQAVQEFLAERGLSLSEEKTHITHIDDGFDFLGWNFRKYKGKLIIKPAQKSVKKLTQKLGLIISKNKSTSQELLIRQLNPVIRGWANQNQAVCAKDTFAKIDSVLWNQLWHWAKRRHPNKNKTWVVNRYWHTENTRKWVFRNSKIKLARFSDTPIVRQPFLRLECNPFLEPDYFEQRKADMRKSKAIAYLKTTAARN